MTYWYPCFLAVESACRVQSPLPCQAMGRELDDAGAAASADRAFHAPVPTPACSYDRTLLIAA